jgi:translocation and assembly module TamB
MLLAIAAILAQAAVFVLSTPQFAAKVRAELISTLEQATGGRVELAAIHWNVWHLAFEVNDLTIHGLEAPSEVPYAHVDRLYIQLKLLALLRPRAGVRVLEIEHPVLHLIVYKDGTTNQPSPKKKSNADPRDTINSIFDLQAGRVSIWNGYVLFNQRSVPFSFSGKDLSLLVRYVPSVSSSANDNYVADLTIADITTSLMKQPEVHSRLQGELVLGRNLAQIQSLQWSTLRSGLTLQGKIENYLAPSITMEAHGKADLRDVAYMADVYQLTGGVAHLDMQAHGTGLDDLLATGQIHLTGGAYKDPYFQIRNVGLETVFSITGKQIVASHVRANAAGGVIVDGSFSLTNWLNQPDALNGKKLPKAD